MRPSRPFVLDPLFRALSALPGIGPKHAKLYEKFLGGGKILDIIFHKPIDLIERKPVKNLEQAKPGDIVIVTVMIEKHSAPPRRGLPYRIRTCDDTGFLDLVFFNAQGAWLEKQYPVHESVTISGKVEDFRGGKQIVHPDLLGKGDDPQAENKVEDIEAVYPLTAGLTNKQLRKSVLTALDFAPAMDEWLEPNYKSRQNFPSWKTAIHDLHHPKNGADLEDSNLSRQRLAYDELLSNQLALSLMRNRQRKMNGRAFNTKGPSRDKLFKSLPWSLTMSQAEVLAEIDNDMKQPVRMSRLLQGDVGSGKTIVAAIAMLNAVDRGCQAAIMAPTEILARQHCETFRQYFKGLGINIVTLTGRDKGKNREALLSKIADGSAQIVIGTHSLFQETIEFRDLGLAVIDEQHRFGVHQRMQLSSKSKGTDVLVMTATPIPRTLTLTAYGDLDVSRITGKPPGRKPIDTRLIPQEKIEDMIAGIERQMASGVRVYWVCPLVEESESLDLQAAEARYAILQKKYGDKVGLIHGRMKAPEKDAVMHKFAAGELSILVATTVIEVGVNVPEATIMVIEHAERFGLAQLHQLRGRVGRGGDQSYCFLVYTVPLSENAKERLSIMRQTEDGFLISEKDLELRGGGEILGTKQSGLPEFRLADLSAHSDLLLTARDDANLIMAQDPELKTQRGQALRTLLYLFEQDQAISYLRTG